METDQGGLHPLSGLVMSSLDLVRRKLGKACGMRPGAQAGGYRKQGFGLVRRLDDRPTFMHSVFATPIKIHDVPVIDKLFHRVMAILSGVGGLDQIAAHGFASNQSGEAKGAGFPVFK